MKQTKVTTKTFVSPQRFASNNPEKLSAEQLNEQIKSLALPPFAPHAPSTYDLFGSDENKYSPSNFSKAGGESPAFVNTVEVAGKRISFVDLVRAISKNLTQGAAKPDRAAAYAKYFAYLSKTLIASVPKLEAAKQAVYEYRQDSVVHSELVTLHDAQLRHEQALSTRELAAIALEESQEQLKLDTTNSTAELATELAALKRQQNKITSILSKGNK